jgi:hypothetical protein
MGESIVMKSKEDMYNKWCELLKRKTLVQDDAFDLATWATEGMIDFPPENKWPEWAAGVRVLFCNQQSMSFAPVGNGFNRYDVVMDIPRSEPRWIPHPDDKVAKWYDSNTGSDIPSASLYRMVTNDTYCHFPKLEQFSDIGKPIEWLKANRKWI